MQKWQATEMKMVKIIGWPAISGEQPGVNLPSSVFLWEKTTLAFKLSVILVKV